MAAKKGRVRKVQLAALDKNSRSGRKRATQGEDILFQQAENHRQSLTWWWPKLRNALRKATTVDDVVLAWRDAGRHDGEHGFVPLTVLAPRILSVLQEPRFWDKKEVTQIRHLADSVAASTGSARRSRDLVGRGRALAERRSATHIKTAEPVWAIECSCGYRGHSKQMACPKCGAEIPLTLLTP